LVAKQMNASLPTTLANFELEVCIFPMTICFHTLFLTYGSMHDCESVRVGTDERV